MAPELISPPALRPRGGHLVSGRDGDRDGGRGTPLFQRAPPQSHENDPRQPAPQAEKTHTRCPRRSGGSWSGCWCGTPGRGATAPELLRHPLPGQGPPPPPPSSRSCASTACAEGHGPPPGRRGTPPGQWGPPPDVGDPPGHQGSRGTSGTPPWTLGTTWLLLSSSTLGSPPVSPSHTHNVGGHGNTPPRTLGTPRDIGDPPWTLGTTWLLLSSSTLGSPPVSQSHTHNVGGQGDTPLDIGDPPWTLGAPPAAVVPRPPPVSLSPTPCWGDTGDPPQCRHPLQCGVTRAPPIPVTPGGPQ
ncbi:hypothetical protein Q9966_016681 [Columba livia]|nr:hypothetical protein Q9966_016681 [Columba livia]KAK2511263.1 hypothetical protein Q9966_016681 [Columba livia]